MKAPANANLGELYFKILMWDLMPAELVLGAGQSPQEAVEAMVMQFPWLPVADIQAHVAAIFARRERS